jgi:hypothetical protein
VRLLGHRELTVQAIARYARRWYRALPAGSAIRSIRRWQPTATRQDARTITRSSPPPWRPSSATCCRPGARSTSGAAREQSTEALGRLAVDVVGVDASTHMIREARCALPFAFAVR